jgi:hypothetical protein
VYAIPGGAPPYRSLLLALLDYSEQVQARGDNQIATIVLPEFPITPPKAARPA